MLKYLLVISLAACGSQDDKEQSDPAQPLGCIYQADIIDFETGDSAKGKSCVTGSDRVGKLTPTDCRLTYKGTPVDHCERQKATAICSDSDEHGTLTRYLYSTDKTTIDLFNRLCIHSK